MDTSALNDHHSGSQGIQQKKLFWPGTRGWGRGHSGKGSPMMGSWWGPKKKLLLTKGSRQKGPSIHSIVEETNINQITPLIYQFPISAMEKRHKEAWVGLHGWGRSGWLGNTEKSIHKCSWRRQEDIHSQQPAWVASAVQQKAAGVGVCVGEPNRTRPWCHVKEFGACLQWNRFNVCFWC